MKSKILFFFIIINLVCSFAVSGEEFVPENTTAPSIEVLPVETETKNVPEINHKIETQAESKVKPKSTVKGALSGWYNNRLIINWNISLLFPKSAGGRNMETGSIMNLSAMYNIPLLDKIFSAGFMIGLGRTDSKDDLIYNEDSSFIFIPVEAAVMARYTVLNFLGRYGIFFKKANGYLIFSTGFTNVIFENNDSRLINRDYSLNTKFGFDYPVHKQVYISIDLGYYYIYEYKLSFHSRTIGIGARYRL